MAVPGNTLLFWEATAFMPPPTNYATPDLRNNQPVLDFDAAIAESVYCSGVMPRHYLGGSFVFRLAWTATTAVSGSVTWSLAFERHDPTTDLDADSFATAINGAPATAPAVSGAPVYTDITVTAAQADGLQAGEHFRLKVSRLVAGGMTGDAELWSVELTEAAAA